jgi:hypothetical protein
MANDVLDGHVKLDLECPDRTAPQRRDRADPLDGHTR